jgi:hypothetical protein
VAKRRRAEDLRSVFGWRLPFKAELVTERLLGLARAAEILAPRAQNIFAHSPIGANGYRPVADGEIPQASGSGARVLGGPRPFDPHKLT